VLEYIAVLNGSDWQHAHACQVEHLTVLEYFGRKRADPKSVLSIMGSALDYARVLLQLKQCKFEVLPAPTIHAQPSAVQVGGSVLAWSLETAVQIVHGSFHDDLHAHQLVILSSYFPMCGAPVPAHMFAVAARFGACGECTTTGAGYDHLSTTQRCMLILWIVSPPNMVGCADGSSYPWSHLLLLVPAEGAALVRGAPGRHCDLPGHWWPRVPCHLTWSRAPAGEAGSAHAVLHRQVEGGPVCSAG
jgi:hypothetical protein